MTKFNWRTHDTYHGINAASAGTTLAPLSKAAAAVAILADVTKRRDEIAAAAAAAAKAAELAAAVAAAEKRQARQIEIDQCHDALLRHRQPRPKPRLSERRNVEVLSCGETPTVDLEDGRQLTAKLAKLSVAQRIEQNHAASIHLIKSRIAEARARMPEDDDFLDNGRKHAEFTARGKVADLRRKQKKYGGPLIFDFICVGDTVVASLFHISHIRSITGTWKEMRGPDFLIKGIHSSRSSHAGKVVHELLYD